MHTPHHHSLKSDPMREVPASPDSSRPPQWNKSNCPCVCGCGCCRRQSDADRDAMTVSQTSYGPSSPSDSIMLETESNVGDYHSDRDSVNGEQGVEDDLIEVGDLGMVGLRVIHRALARHGRCTCHAGILPDSNDYPLDSPVDSLFLPAPMIDSMAVEHGSDASESITLSQAFSMASQSSSAILGHTGEGAGEDRMYHQMEPGAMIRPLWLTPERTLCQHAEIRTPYPTHLFAADFKTYDLW